MAAAQTPQDIRRRMAENRAACKHRNLRAKSAWDGVTVVCRDCGKAVRR